jgi:hypothetical protein
MGCTLNIFVREPAASTPIPTRRELQRQARHRLAIRIHESSRSSSPMPSPRSPRDADNAQSIAEFLVSAHPARVERTLHRMKSRTPDRMAMALAIAITPMSGRSPDDSDTQPDDRTDTSQISNSNTNRPAHISTEHGDCPAQPMDGAIARLASATNSDASQARPHPIASANYAHSSNERVGSNEYRHRV